MNQNRVEMKDDRAQEVTASNIRRRSKARYNMDVKSSASGRNSPSGSGRGGSECETGVSDYNVYSFLQELEKERSSLLREMAREDEDRQWYIMQLETLAQKLEALPYGDSDISYPAEVDVSRRQLQHDAQRIRELMRKNLGTAEEIHARFESRSHRIRMVEAEMLRIQQHHHRQHQQLHHLPQAWVQGPQKSDHEKRDSGTCDHLELEKDGVVMRDVATNTITIGEEMRHEVEPSANDHHRAALPYQQSRRHPSQPLVTMATQTDAFTDARECSQATPLDVACGGLGRSTPLLPPPPPPPSSLQQQQHHHHQCGEPPLSSLYHGSWPIQEGYEIMYNGKKGPLADMTSVMSFGSSHFTTGSRQAVQHNLGNKVEMVYSLLSMLGTHDKDDMSRTLLAMSSSPDSCVAMRQSGCLPLIIQLLHGSEKDSSLLGATRGGRHARARAAAALHNIVHSHPDDKRGRREARVLRLLEQVRAHCDQLSDEDGDADLSDDLDHHPGPAIAALMKLSFDEEHRHAICSLGGLQAIAELLRVDFELHQNTSEQYNTTMRRYACMALTNLTFGDGANKALLCSMKGCMRALVGQLNSENEDLRQVAASVIRNLSWRADLASKKTLREIGAVCKLMHASLNVRKESTLKSILSALWNLSAHCSENKSDICAVDGALAFLVSTLVYKSPSKTLAIIENGGGILRNISSHIAVCEDYRRVLREHSCLQILLKHLRSPSLTIVSNACGTLWNLSARCQEDQKTLWEMGAVSMLRNLVHSKHKMISMGSTAALKNLLAARPYLNCMDGSFEGKPRSDFPTLAVRKQRALEAELDHTLSETCENVESPQPSPTETRRTGTNYNYPLYAKETSKNLKDSKAKKIDLQTLDKCMEELKIKDTPPPDVEVMPPLLVNNFLTPKKETFQEEEKPTDYSLRYAEQVDEGPYTDQPIDYSRRYEEAEVVDTELRYVQARRANDVIEDESNDVIQTFCTEGTPLNCLSKAASLTDLSGKVERILEEEDPEDQVQDFASKYAAEDKHDVTLAAEASNEVFETLSEPGDKPLTYCVEGTPICSLSHASSLNNLSADDDDKSPKERTKSKLPLTKDQVKQVTPVSQKSVKFDAQLTRSRASQQQYHAQETPLMFSRCSSLESLDSFESHSVHSSVVSEYSRRASEVVSPSELPDSPSDSIPHSPKYKRKGIPTPRGEGRLLVKTKVIEQDEVPTVFATEGTPHNFSSRTSLSSLSVDGSPKDVKIVQPTLKEPDTASVSEISEGEEDILKQCINSAMPAPNPKKFRKSSSDYSIKKKPARERPMSKSVTEMRSDGVRVYAMEGTPSNFSLNGSLSDLSFTSERKSREETECARMNLRAPLVDDAQSDSSAYSDEHDLLSEVILFAMPKSNKAKGKTNEKASVEASKNDELFRFSSEDTPFESSFGALSDVVEASPEHSPPRPNITLMENHDTTRTFAVEGTPVTFSCNDSLSSLSIDDESDARGRRLLPYGAASPGSTGRANSRFLDTTLRHSADGRSNSTPEQSLSPITTANTTRAQKYGKLSKENCPDQTMTFALEDTPLHFSMNSSLSSMNSDEHEAPAFHRDDDHHHHYRDQSARSSRSGSERGGAMGFAPTSETFLIENSPCDFSCNSSLSSLSLGSDSMKSEQALLAECITSAMPKRKVDKSDKSKNGQNAMVVRENSTSFYGAAAMVGDKNIKECENERRRRENEIKRSSSSEEILAQYRIEDTRRWSTDKEKWINQQGVPMSISLTPHLQPQNPLLASTGMRSLSRSDSYSSATDDNLTVLDATQAAAMLTVDDSNKDSNHTISLSLEQSGSLEIDAAKFQVKQQPQDDDRTEALDVDLEDEVANLPLDEDVPSTDVSSPSTENGSVIERSGICTDDEDALEENANLIVSALDRSVDDDSLIENETISLVSNEYTEYSSASDPSELTETTVSTATLAVDSQAESVKRGPKICKPGERREERAEEQPKGALRGGKKTYGISPRKNIAPIKALAKPENIKITKTAAQRMALNKSNATAVTQENAVIKKPAVENAVTPKKVVKPKPKTKSPPVPSPKTSPRAQSGSSSSAPQDGSKAAPKLLVGKSTQESLQKSLSGKPKMGTQATIQKTSAGSTLQKSLDDASHSKLSGDNSPPLDILEPRKIISKCSSESPPPMVRQDETDFMRTGLNVSPVKIRSNSAPSPDSAVISLLPRASSDTPSNMNFHDVTRGKSEQRRGSSAARVGPNVSRIATPIRRAPRKLDNESEDRPQPPVKQRTFTKDLASVSGAPKISPLASPESAVDQNGNCTDDITINSTSSAGYRYDSLTSATQLDTLTDNFTKFSLDTAVLEAVELSLHNVCADDEDDNSAMSIEIPPRPKSTPVSENNRNQVKAEFKAAQKHSELGVKTSQSAGQLRYSSSPVRGQRRASYGIQSPQRKDSPRNELLGRSPRTDARRPSLGSNCSSRSESPNQKRPGVLGKKQVTSKIAGLWKTNDENEKEKCDESKTEETDSKRKLKKDSKDDCKRLAKQEDKSPRKLGKIALKSSSPKEFSNDNDDNAKTEKKSYEKSKLVAPLSTKKSGIPRSSTYEKVSEPLETASSESGRSSAKSKSGDENCADSDHPITTLTSGSDSKLLKYIIGSGKMLTSVAKGPVKQTSMQVAKVPGSGVLTRIAVETKRSQPLTINGSVDSLVTGEALKGDDSGVESSRQDSQGDDLIRQDSQLDDVSQQDSKDDSKADSDVISTDISESDSSERIKKTKRGFSLFKRSNSVKGQKVKVADMRQSASGPDVTSPVEVADMTSPTKTKPIVTDVAPKSPTKSLKSELVKILSPKFDRKKSKIPTSPKHATSPKSPTIDDEFSLVDYNRKCSTLGSPRSSAPPNAQTQNQAKASTLPANMNSSRPHVTKTDMLLARRQNLLQRRASVDSTVSETSESKACLVTTV